MAYTIKELPFGELLDTSVKLTSENLPALLGIAVRTFAIPFIVCIIGVALLFAVHPVAGGVVLGFGVLYMLLVAMPMAAGAIIYAVSSDYLGRKIDATTALEAAKPFRSALITTVVLRGLCMFGLYVLAALTLVGAIFGIPFFIALVVYIIVFYYRTWLIVPIVVVENTVNMAAINRSTALILGSKGKAFGIDLIMFVGSFLISLALGLIPFVGPIINIGVSILQQIFMAVVMVVLYFSCRCKHENYDLAMLANTVQVDTPPATGAAPNSGPATGPSPSTLDV